ncbi:uncharacterized protein LOC124686636 [Lolium rigidum]|uniref:uncharacterized protein LOC124686636 n=1 Tax=Lolium rigidum TaxID=89674 RepID=UPI001F5C146F|nr:uncharacterized protein LOC124686636 [Lolium rigidum]
MATEVLRPHNILPSQPQRIRTAHRKPSARKSPPPPAAAASSTAGRRNHGRRPAVELYAGPAFSGASPEPSSLPLPQFPLQKAVAPAVNDAATRDLRRLLRLE